MPGGGTREDLHDVNAHGVSALDRSDQVHQEFWNKVERINMKKYENIEERIAIISGIKNIKG